MTVDWTHIKTVAVRCPTWVGDIVMATPVFECLRTNLPQARIVAVVKKMAQGILRDSPWVDAFVDGDDKSWAGFVQMRDQLLAERPEAAILLANSWRSALTARLSGIKTVYGYRRQGRSILLSGGPLPRRDGGRIVPIPMIDYYLDICRWSGLTIPDHPKPQLHIGPDLRRRGEALLGKLRIAPTDFVVGMNPGASFGSSKCWPVEYFAQLARMCHRSMDAKVMLFSGPNEGAIIRAILDQVGSDVIDLRPEHIDLEMLKPLVERCNLMVTNDTGPRHYAVAFDVPVVVIMGSTDPRYTDANMERTVVVRRELDCSPCHKKVCPRQHECMRQIEPAEVYAAAETLVGART
jgi:heptosyltransferase II